MRIDVASPVLPPVSAVPAPPARPAQAAAPAPPKDELKQRTESASTNVLVEMEKGNILVFKFIDEASGRTIQQIPSSGMLNLAESIEASVSETKGSGK